MRALLVFIFFCIFLLFARRHYVCEIKGLCDDPDDYRLKTLALSEGDRMILRGYDQFAFDTAQVAPRLNRNSRNFLDAVAKHLLQNPEKQLNITAFFRESEKEIKSGFYENLGVARAAEIRQELMRRGIEEDRITLDYGMSQSASFNEPALFEVYSPLADGSFERRKFTFHNMTFTQAEFRFDSDKFQPGEPFRLYADSVKTYLELNPQKRLVIIGHADFIGQQDYNEDLGMRRAENARQYLRNLGVTSDIEVKSMGESRPVASNATAEGRAKNRRVNFIIEDNNR